MQKHTVVYFLYFSYDISSFVPCELCGKQAVDVHHIIKRSKFGKKRKHEQDLIGNLIGLCRNHHDQAEANTLSREYLTEVHFRFMRTRKPELT